MSVSQFLLPEHHGGPTLRQGERTRTIPEQIADHVGVAILNGEYRAGERIREQELAMLYGVSRGPVREAIRALEKRGLLEFFPRRGAYVVELNLDAIADVFNVRATLMGLAARCFARRREKKGHEILQRRIAELDHLARSDVVDPVRFARVAGRIGAEIARNCGNAALTRMLSDQVEQSLWGLIWRERPLDFLTRRRCLQAVAEWREVVLAIEERRDRDAETLQRRIHFKSRDHALAILQRLRGEAVDPARLLNDS
jgi:DNA-binding GntR family transcriptional regulator